MPQPPFDVTIHVEAQSRGVHKIREIANGYVDGPTGPVQVQLGIHEPLEPAERETMRFAVFVGDQGLVVDVTDMLERIAHELLRPDEPPTKTFEFKKRGPNDSKQ